MYQTGILSKGKFSFVHYEVLSFVHYEVLSFVHSLDNFLADAS